jgi:D-beta-D-heptose 7-phosphate kinase/D-beta-D-heptose 1-phosphate adenosyltransferase
MNLPSDTKDWNELLARLARGHVLVAGDLILDHYIHGRTDRTSPEAPVPVVLYEREYLIPGGAANVARNVAHFGARVACVGVVGDDDSGRLLCQLLAAENMECSGIVCSPDRPTTVKTRIISHNQQMLRLDRESSAELSPQTEAAVLESVARLLPDCTAVVVSDYAKGLLTPRVLERLLGLAQASGVPLFVDPKGRDYARYRGAFALTPNAREAAEAAGVDTETDSGIAEAARRIHEVTQCEWVVITRGAKGVALYHAGDEPIYVPTLAREVFDVTGAGDTFIAFLALGVGVGLEMRLAAHIANVAAGIVVGKVGAATVSRAELLAACAPVAVSRKLVAAEDLRELGERLRRAGKRIVFTNGCFDFLHAGHVALLQEAKRLGDVLVVATNTDEMITRLKGAPRPILKQRDRERLLAAIEAVDHIVVFADETPHRIIEQLRPDVLVKGRNYRLEQVEGHEVVERYGGQVVLLETFEAISTRELVDRHQKHSRT